MSKVRRLSDKGWWWLLASLLMACIVYAPGLHGGFLFDDYPNIVDNHGVQPTDASLGTLVGAALSSPSSEFKRPMASLSFALNYLVAGLDPYWMKLTNLLIHLVNGWLVFLLTRTLLRVTDTGIAARQGALAAWIAGAWMLLPINLTAVLYVVQRMESMANAFVLLGLIGYTKGRQAMLASPSLIENGQRRMRVDRPFLLSLASLVLPTALGLLAKETAVMLPLYAALIEWVVFGFRRTKHTRDPRITSLFLVVLIMPMVIGLVWLLPNLLDARTWATRDFSLRTRLLSEARIVVDYIDWTLVPLPNELSFYHDDFAPSVGLLTPWTTLASATILAILLALSMWFRKKQPLVSLGLLLFFGCHLLTGTILPLELIYEHRNYFASFGLLLASMPFLAALSTDPLSSKTNTSVSPWDKEPLFALPRRALLITLVIWWAAMTALTATAWGDPLHLAQELAARAPESPRAQYELGRTYIIYSHYDPASPFTQLAYAPLERATGLPGSSILPQQALIFMNSRMHLPLKDAWWNSMVAKLKSKRPGVQDESSLGALTQCAHEQLCELPRERMVQAFTAALSHPAPSARLLATYGDYAWNVLGDRDLGERMAREAVAAEPGEPAYLITLIRMLYAQGRGQETKQALTKLRALNTGGRLDDTIHELQRLSSLK